MESPLQRTANNEFGMHIQNRAPKHTERFKVVNAGRPTGGDAQGRGPPIVVRDGSAVHMAKGQPTKVGQSVPLDKGAQGRYRTVSKD